MIHVFSAPGAETRDGEPQWAIGLRGMAAGIGARDGCGPFGSGMIRAIRDLAQRSAFADSFIDGSASAPAEAAQHEPLRTHCVMHRTSAWTAGSLRHGKFVAKPALGADAGAIEPRLVEILAGLHVKSHGDGIRRALRIGRRPAAIASAKILCGALSRDEDAPVVPPVTILRVERRRRERAERDHK